METLGIIIGRFRRWQYSGLFLLLVIVLILHFSIIMVPNYPPFDEIHYVEDSRVIVNEQLTQRPEHPPLGKLFIVAGMHLFGDNPFGWRIFPVLFGAAGIVFMYLICRRLNLSKRVSYFAAFLLAIENLTFIQGSIGMLDVFSLTFTLAAFWLYLKERYVLSGAMVALSALAKLNGALAIVVIGLHWLLSGRKHQWRFLFSMLSAPILFIALMPLCDYIIWGEWLNPVSQIQEMMDITGRITFASYEPGGIATRPWMWILAPLVINYWYTPHYIGMISPTVWVFIMPLVLYIIWRAIKGENVFMFIFAWFLGLYLTWIPASLITDRASYLFYFYPTIGAICIGLAVVLFKLLNVARLRRRGKLQCFLVIVALLYPLGHLIAFMRLSPVTLWLSIPWGLLLYIITLRYMGIFKWYRPWRRTAATENQVDMPPQQE